MSSISAQPHRTHLTLLLGGVRSGKSARAVALAAERQCHGKVLFVATAQPFDDEMAARIVVHRQERPDNWETLESPLHLAEELQHALAISPEPYTAIVIDCVTLWVSNILLSLNEQDDAEAIVSAHVERLLAVYTNSYARSGGASTDGSPATQWIIVSNEVGLGVVPPTPLGRSYRDALGRANQQLAKAADDVTLMVAGLTLPLKLSTPDRTG